MLTQQERLAKIVRARRHDMGLSQEQLAEKIDKSTSFIGQIERGECFPKFETLQDLVTCLEIDANELFSDKPITHAGTTLPWSMLGADRPLLLVHLDAWFWVHLPDWAVCEGMKTARQLTHEIGVSKEAVYKRSKGKNVYGLRSVCAYGAGGSLYRSGTGAVTRSWYSGSITGYFQHATKETRIERQAD